MSHVNRDQLQAGAATEGRKMPTFHVRKPLPPKGGNSFYRDKSDRTKFSVSVCGAPITSNDVDFRTAGTKRFLNSDFAKGSADFTARNIPTCCTDCLKAMQS